MMRRWKSKGISSTFAKVGDVGWTCVFGMGKHGTIENVLQSGLEVAIQVREREHSVVLAQHHITMALENDLVHRQCAGLVGAQHVHRAEVLDGVDPFNDDLVSVPWPPPPWTDTPSQSSAASRA